MRLLLLTQDFPPETGGIQTYSYELAKRLNDQADHQVVVAPNPKGSEEVDAKLPFEVERINISNPLLFLPLVWKLPTILSKHKSDIVFHTQWQTLLPSVLAKRSGLIKKIAVAAHARELLFNPFGKGLLGNLYSSYQFWLLKHVDHFYPVSEYTGKLLVDQGIDESKISVITNGTDPELFYPKDVTELRSELGLSDRKVILTVGRLVKRKGVDTVLEALPEVIKAIPNVTYLIVGPAEEGDYLNSLKALISEHDLNKYVQFTGSVPFIKLNEYYNLADVFTMPSKSMEPDVEGFGIVFLEANACKKPVIGSDSGGIPSAIIDGGTGFIIPEGNAKMLAQKLIEILSNEDLKRQLGENGYHHVQKNANWDAVGKKLFKHLSDLLP